MFMKPAWGSFESTVVCLPSSVGETRRSSTADGRRSTEDCRLSTVMKISAVVNCGNEQRNIADCLESVKWCDEIVVVDSMSTDRTAEIAKNFTDKIIRRPWPGYIAQKNFALEQATGDWIL